jgi:TonB family protein
MLSHACITGVLIGAAAAVAIGAVALAAAPGSPEGIKPIWLQQPTLRDIMRAYPVDEHNAGAEGMAMIGCRVAQDGRLTACAVVQQTPSWRHFGAAGLKLAPDFRMAAKDEDGRPTAGAVVRLPIEFKLTDDARLDGSPRR